MTDTSEPFDHVEHVRKASLAFAKAAKRASDLQLERDEAVRRAGVAAKAEAEKPTTDRVFTFADVIRATRNAYSEGMSRVQAERIRDGKTKGGAPRRPAGGS